MKFVIYEDTKGEYHWSLVAANGRIMADGSEGYDSRSNAERAIDTIVTEIRNTYKLPVTSREKKGTVS